MTTDARSPLDLHRELAWAARQRSAAEGDTAIPRDILALERQFLDDECAAIAARAAIAPKDVDSFRVWFADLDTTGPGQHDPLFDFVAWRATFDQIRWVVAQEIAAGTAFDDLVGLRGVLSIHELAIEPVWEALAVANLMAGFELSPVHAYHSVGALGAVELTTPARVRRIAAGLRRLGVDDDAWHSDAPRSPRDVVGADRWNDPVIESLVAEDPSRAEWIAQGALARLAAAKRAFDRYRVELGLSSPADTTMRRITEGARP